ncbi:MAG: hypothetical protein A2Y40_08050 [Candidatus Margulisbacteria bacterium GWF2_35_9]|nr:MAG: hypothetical protein A2Y40_08050 [Candidatus Margulisbacteria bacterium GWF2_35_9]
MIIDSKKKTVLIVDDEEIVWTILREALSALDLYIIVALNGYEAIEQNRVMKPDLVIMDYKMPDIDGWKAAKQIKQFNKDAVIIGHTAYVNDEMMKIGLASGCNEILLKPVDLDIWTETMYKYLNLKK